MNTSINVALASHRCHHVDAKENFRPEGCPFVQLAFVDAHMIILHLSSLDEGQQLYTQNHIFNGRDRQALI
jgi:hypothetical protein